MNAAIATDKQLSIAILGTTVLVVCGLLYTRIDYVPIWDGRIYAACISAAGEQFTPEALRCAGHVSHAYVAVAALAQMLAPASIVPLLMTNAGLFFVAALGFHRLVALVFPAARQPERALLTAAFALQPAFLASVVQPALDLPLLPGFVWSIVFALERRWVPLILAGLWLAFTKETGVLLYAVVLASYAVWFELRSPRPIRERFVRVLRLAPLALPGAVFVAYLAVRALTRPEQPVIWYGSTTDDSLLRQFLLPRLDLYQVNYAVLILMLNFSWVLSGVIGLDWFVGTVRAAHREPARPVPSSDRRFVGFITVVAVATAYALTRFTTFGHTRYFLPVYALMVVLFYVALLRLGAPTKLRLGALSAYTALILVATVRTVDPVSKWIYGTFPVGSHSMLRMTRVTGECCGFGQDQLVYSLEFTVFQKLTDEALSPIVASPSPTIVVPDSTSWIFLDPPTERGRLFANRGWHGKRPRVFEHRQLVLGQAHPDSALYLAMPYGDNGRAMRELAPLYAFEDERRYTLDGYALSTYRLVSRSRSP